MRARVSIERLRAVMAYDPITGKLTLLQKSCPQDRRTVGCVLGTPNDGYLVVRLDGRSYKAHILAWAHHYGKWPEGEVDHRDLDGTHNSIQNLREATHGQNQANCRAYKGSSSGLKGAYPSKGRWASSIRKDGKLHHLGYFDTAEEAHRAYAVRAVEFHGDFARIE